MLAHSWLCVVVSRSDIVYSGGTHWYACDRLLTSVSHAGMLLRDLLASLLHYACCEGMHRTMICLPSISLRRLHLDTLSLVLSCLISSSYLLTLRRRRDLTPSAGRWLRTRISPTHSFALDTPVNVDTQENAATAAHQAEKHADDHAHGRWCFVATVVANARIASTVVIAKATHSFTSVIRFCFSTTAAVAISAS